MDRACRSRHARRPDHRMPRPVAMGRRRRRLPLGLRTGCGTAAGESRMAGRRQGAGRASAHRPGGARAAMRRRAAAGVALPELMVAVALGLVLILAASALLMLARSSYLLIDDRARIEESGRYAIEIISQAVRQAGYRDWSAAGAVETGWLAVAGLDARSLKDASDGTGGPYGAAVNGSDVLALRFDGNSSGSGDMAMKNCAGASVAADGPGA